MAAEMPTVLGYGPEGKKLCAKIDILKASQVDEVGLDDEITVVVKGKVRSLRGKEEYKSKDYEASTEKGRQKEIKRIIPGSVELEISEMQVYREGEFDGLMEE